MPPYARIEKRVGETPLQALEQFRSREGIPLETPLAYAGRLDPMASGALLILIGDECKRQEHYHGLDKEYYFEVLFGVGSDTGDVLGIIRHDEEYTTTPTTEELRTTASNVQGTLTLPYPSFSSKTVAGKPLHTWTLEGRLDEIDIPTYTNTVYKLELCALNTVPLDELVATARTKIDTLPPVTDVRKAIGNDFRRSDVRASWDAFHALKQRPSYPVAQFRCIAQSGTYMRTLAEEIARRVGTIGLAYSIHRNTIGIYQSLPFGLGLWRKRL